MITGYKQETYEMLSWTKIKTISAGLDHIVGLKRDGTVNADGTNYCGECDVSEWDEIIAAKAGEHRTVCLKNKMGRLSL